MFGDKKRKERARVLAEMDGREVKYVTRRQKAPDGTKQERIMGKNGRMIARDGVIRVMCGLTDVFITDIQTAEYFTLLDGSGITISGQNLVTGLNEDIVVYYTYYRK